MILFEHKTGEFLVHHTRDEVFDPRGARTHTHRWCELYYFMEGDGYYTVEGNHYTLAPGTILLMRNGEAHMPHIAPTLPYERIAVHFPNELLDGDTSLTSLFFDRPLGIGNVFLPDTTNADFLRATLLRLCGTDLPSTDRRIRAYLLPVLYELANRRHHNREEDIPPARPHDPLVIEIIEFINAHLTEDFDLDELSHRFFFSKSYINRVFRAETGSSVWDYVVAKRLLYARSLLGRGTTAAGAAAQSGFADYSSFFRLYRRRFGASPTHDRQDLHTEIITAVGPEHL